jgi:PAS domain S-box-containing protein
MAELGFKRAHEHRPEKSIGGAEEWLRLLIDNVEGYAVFLLDREARVMSWNAGVQQLLGYDRAEFLGLPFTRLFRPNHQAAAQRDIDRARTAGCSKKHRSHVGMDGRKVWVRGVLMALWDPARQLRGYVYMMRDRTAEHQAAAERLELFHREHTARADADRANQTKDAFLAAVSHELRTPLNAILGWAHLLSAGHLSQEKTAHAIQTIERNAKAQAQLIDDLLDASRMMTGKLELDVHSLTFSSVVKAAVESVQPEADAKHVHVSLSSADDPEPIEGDANRLRQVVVKVLANAIKFTPVNGVIMVSVGHTDREAELQVCITGDGLSAEALAHLFDRFDQGGESGRIRPSVGLGLDIARRIIEAHGGTITAAGEDEGTGGTLTVRLPFALGRRTGAEVHGTPPSANEVCPPALAGRCALVVEDQPDSREFVDAVLVHCGMRVIAVDSVHEALEALDAKPVDVIISDIGLAGEDGLTLMRRVRERPPERGGKVPAIAVSAYGGPADRTRALEAGYQTYIAKPLDPVDVIAAVSVLVRLA